jgi:hypothetical protein
LDILLKLLAVPMMVGLASLVAQRFGPGFAGVLSGLPVIASTVTALLMTHAPREKVMAVASASYQSIPAAFAYTAAFAWMAYWLEETPEGATRSKLRAWLKACGLKEWLMCLLAAGLAFLLMSLVLLATSMSPLVAIPLTLACPLLTLSLMPKHAKFGDNKATTYRRIPSAELFLRMLIALLMAAFLLFGAERLSPAWSGIALVWPVTGCVLPCFTLALYGTQATIDLLRGFANGLFGFTAFFICLSWLLENGSPYVVSFALSILCSASAAWLLLKLRQR